ATAVQATALGVNASASGTSALALGANASAGNAGDVALGSGSVTDVAVGTPSAVIGGKTYNFAGTTPASTVSVGAPGAERTITNVAAGRLNNGSTDAVNGSQLFATNQQVDLNTTGITNLNNEITNINTGAGIKYFHANSTLPDSQAIGTNSVAVGPNAVANNAGDVAIGLNAASGATTAVSGATVGGTAYTFAGATPAGAFSVGSAGAERQIQNVAAGQLNGGSTDAVNGSQLFATNQAVDSLNTTVTTIGGNLTNLGSTINNIAGDTSTTYTDANGKGIRYVRTNDRTLAVSDSSAQGIGSTAVGYNATSVADNSLALGMNSQATIVGGVALGSGSVADRALAPATGQIAAGPTNFIQYNTTDKTLLGAVSVGSSTSYRQIINVADGTSAQDAVTVRQLQGAIASVATTPSKYFHANSAAGDSLAVGAESVAVGPTTVVNGDNGIGIGNGAIVDQVAPGGTAIGQNAHVMLADGVALGTNSVAGGVQSVALGAGAQSNNINSVALGAQSVTSVGAETNYTGFALTSPQTSVGEVSIGSAGAERKLTNVAAGSANTDAVNVSQLRGLGTNITNLIGGNTTVNPDGSITGPTYNIQGNSYSTVYDAFGAVDNSLTSIINGGGIKYFHANSTLADSQASGTDSVAIGPQSVASGVNSLAAGNGAAAVGQGAVALGQGAQANNANDVALGSGSSTQAAVGTSGTTLQGQHYDFAGTAPVGTVSVGAAGAERTITNVAAGRISADSTDAINGSQLYATNSAIDSLQTGVGTITKNAVTYDLNPDGSKKNSITLQGGDVNAPVVISNVGKGIAPTDAVNVAQLGDSITEVKSYTDTSSANTLTAANNYTDQKFGQLNQELGDIRSEARQAAAIGLAAASLRYDDRPGKLSVAVGGGLWRGEGAVAFGAGYTSENGRVRANLSGTAAGGQVGVGAGVSFTLN
ncbi:MAG: YadA-like family protein, partial [Rhizobium tropici]|nr:YadA-like family protein [Rhizobium tropici]